MKTPIIALALLALSARAQTETTDHPVTVTFTPTYVSEYMFRGVQLDGASLEPVIEADVGHTAIGVWSNLPFELAGQIRVDEVDPYASYTIPLNSSWSLVPDFEIYTYSASSAANGYFRAQYEPNLSLVYNAHGLRVSPTVYYNLTLRALTLELTASTAVPLASLGTELDFNGTLGTYTADRFLETDGPNQKATGSYWLLGASIPYQLAKNLKATIGYAYTEGFAARTQIGPDPRVENTSAVGRSVLSASLTISF